MLGAGYRTIKTQALAGNQGRTTLLTTRPGLSHRRDLKPHPKGSSGGTPDNSYHKSHHLYTKGEWIEGW